MHKQSLQHTKLRGVERVLTVTSTRKVGGRDGEPTSSQGLRNYVARVCLEGLHLVSWGRKGLGDRVTWHRHPADGVQSERNAFPGQGNSRGRMEVKGDCFRAGPRFRAGFLVAVRPSKSFRQRSSQPRSPACPFRGKADIAFPVQGQRRAFPRSLSHSECHSNCRASRGFRGTIGLSGDQSILLGVAER